MGRRGRPRKSKVTYQSRETRTFVGALCFIFSLVLIASVLVESNSILLEKVKSLFGDVTVVAAFVFFNISLYLFGVHYVLSKSRSLIGQILFLFSTLVIFTLLADEKDLLLRAENGEVGGLSGYYISRFLERQIFAQFTILIAIIILFFSVPLMFLMTLSQFVEKVSKAIKDYIDGVKKRREERLLEAQKAEEAKPQVETFGDFSKKFENIPVPAKQPSDEKQHDSSNVKITESSNGDAIVNEELQYPNWKLPSAELLNDPPVGRKHHEDIKGKSEVIEETLSSFGIHAKVVNVSVGPTVTQYAIDIPLGTKVSKIANLKNDIALALAVASNAVRIEAPIPGTSYIGIEVPNSQRQAVYFKEIAVSKEIVNPKFRLPVTVGKDITGSNVVADVQKMPHLLVAGATGSGKSVLTNSFIMSLLMYKSPDQVRFIMVDPKQVELSDYNGIPHLLTPVITDMDKVNNALKWAIAEMERRYTLFKDNLVRNIEDYNDKKGFSALPYIMIVIDEMADMMMVGGAEIESSIVRLAQKARATGMHLILATQRPSVDVITGLIKANIPGRVGMSVTTQIDSRVILDQIGAESLLGMGDLLFKEPDKNKPNRLQGVLITQAEVQRVVTFIKEQVDEVTYNKDITKQQVDPNLPAGARQSAKFSDDELFADAARVVVASGRGSSSLIQRKLSVGYNRAARLLDELHKFGVVGPAKGSKPRDVLVSDIEAFLSQGNGEED